MHVRTLKFDFVHILLLRVRHGDEIHAVFGTILSHVVGFCLPMQSSPCELYKVYTIPHSWIPLKVITIALILSELNILM